MTVPERDARTFKEYVERINVAFLVSLPVKEIKRFAQLVEDAINEVGGKFVYSKTSSSRLFIQEDRPPVRRSDYHRRDERKQFDYGVD